MREEYVTIIFFNFSNILQAYERNWTCVLISERTPSIR